MKPAGLVTRLIAATTEPGDLVVDPAAGSFVVMHAARQLGREFIGCDLAYAATSNLIVRESGDSPRRSVHDQFSLRFD